MSKPSQPRRTPLGLYADRPGPRLYDRMIEVLRVRHYSRRTEEAYVYWIRRFLEFHGHEHPSRLAEEAANRFLTHLAVKEHVAASTQNQALAAILFLYQHVLQQPLDRIEGVVRAKRPRRLPVVLTPDEVTRVMMHLRGDKWLVAMLLYGGGLRLLEALRLRVKDLDFQRGEITVREGKGDKDRVTMLPQAVIPPLQQHLKPHLSPLLCDPFAAGRLRHPHRAGAVGPQGRAHHHDLHPRFEPRRTRRAKPRRPPAAGRSS